MAEGAGYRVVEAACAGCGNCGAACTFGAITMRHFTDRQITAQIHQILAERSEDRHATALI